MVSVMVFGAPQETSDHLDPKRVEVIGLMFVRRSAKPSGRAWRLRAFYLYWLFDGYGLDINTRHVIRKRKNQNSKRNAAEMLNSMGIPYWRIAGGDPTHIRNIHRLQTNLAQLLAQHANKLLAGAGRHMLLY
jgi:hypothetical protein